MTILPEKTRLDPEHPYPGPSSFDEEHAAFFHGRGREADELFALVELRPLTVLYGKSGLGKTSLLQAGLFPRMRKAGLVPLRLRLGFGVDEEGQRHPSLPDQVRRRLREAIEQGELDGAPPREDESLWEYFHWTGFWDGGGRPVTALLVLDQFEEVFTLGHDRGGELRALVRELSDLVENRIPASLRDAVQAGRAKLPPSYGAAGAKVMISLREEFLAQLDDHRQQMPSLSASRYRLRPLGGPAARDAVLEPGRAVVTEEVAAAIVRKVGSAADDAPLDTIEEVEPALLALYCHELNAIRDRHGMPTIDAALLAGSEKEILEQFYERGVRGMPAPVRLLVEEKLLTPDNRRDTLAIRRVGDLGVVEADVHTLVDRRLLRKEPRLGHEYVEIVHDKLVPTIAARRDERRRREREDAEQREKEAAEVERRARDAEAQEKREEELREQAEEGKRSAEAERLRADAERLRADAERLRAEEGERRRALAEKLATTRMRSNVILWAMVALLALVPAYRVWNARDADKKAKIAADSEHIESNRKRAAELSALGWRAAVDQRWDDVARMLAPAYGALKESGELHETLGRSGSGPRPTAEPLLALLASRFEASTGGIESVFPDPTGINAFVVTRDGRTAATLGSDGLRVAIIDLTGGKPRTEAEPAGFLGSISDKDVSLKEVVVTDAFSGAVRALVPSGDGSLLFGQGDKGQIVVWRMSDGHRCLGLRTPLLHGKLAVDDAGRRVVLWDRDLGKALVVWIDPEAGLVERTVPLSLEHEKTTPPSAAGWTDDSDWWAIVPTPDGKHVLGVWDDAQLREGGARERRARADLELWDSATGRRVAGFTPRAVPAHPLPTGRVRAMSISEDGGLLALLFDEGEVHVFRLGADELELAATLPQRVPADGSIAFQGPRRDLCVTTESTFALWDLERPEAPRQRLEIGTGGAPRRVALTPDGKEALVWVDDEVRLHDLALGQPSGVASLQEAERRGPGGAVQLRAGEGARRVVTARDDALRVRSLRAAARPLDRYLWGEAGEAKATFSSLIPRAGEVEEVADDGEEMAVLADGSVSIVRPAGADRLRIAAWTTRDPALVRAVRLRAGRVAALDDGGVARFGWGRSSALLRAREEVGWGGLLALDAGGAWAATAGRGPRIYLWNMNSGRMPWAADMRQQSSTSPFDGDDVGISALAVAADDPTHPRAVVGDARGGVRLLRTGGVGKAIWTAVPFTPSPHRDVVRAVEIGPGGRVATGAEDGTIALWEKDGRIVRTWAIETSGSSGVRLLRFADEGRLLVSGGADSAVHVFRTTDGAEVCAMRHGDEIIRLAIERGPAPHAASVDAAGTANLWKLATCEPVRSLRGMAYVGFLAGAHDRIVTIRRTGRVELWPTGGSVSDVPRDRPRGTAAWGVFLGEGTLATGDEEGSLFAFRLDGSAPPARLAGEIGGVPSVASASGRAVAVTPEGLVRAWSTDAVDIGLVSRLPLDRGWSVRAAALWDDGASLLSLEEGPDGALRARTFAWGKWTSPGPPVELRGGARCDASAVPAGRTFVVGAIRGGPRALVIDGAGCVRVWDSGGKLLVEGLGPSGSPTDASGRVSAAALGRSGDRLVLAGSDGAVSTWAIEGETIRRLALERRRHTARVRAVAFHPEGHFVVTAGDDRQAWLWDPRDGRPLARLGAHPAPIHWAVFRPGGAEVVTGGADGWMRVWSTRTQTPADDAPHVLEVLGKWLPEVGKAGEGAGP